MEISGNLKGIRYVVLTFWRQPDTACMYREAAFLIPETADISIDKYDRLRLESHLSKRLCDSQNDTSWDGKATVR